MSSSSSNAVSPHVLIVDDQKLYAKSIEHHLVDVEKPFRVSTVTSGKRALELLGANNNGKGPLIPEVDLILVDYYMPEMSGYDLLKRIKESSTLMKIPVVVMSCDSDPDIIKRCLEAGAEDFVKKPVNDKLYELCKSILEQGN